MHISKLTQLTATDGAALRKYNRLLVEAEGAQAGSTAATALAQFQHDYERDPVHVEHTAEIEEEEATVAEEQAKLEALRSSDSEQENDHGRTSGSGNSDTGGQAETEIHAPRAP